MIVHIEYDLPYLPLPNRAEFVLTAEESPADLTSTAFMLAVSADGVVMANNARRGMECSGGHIEPGETARQAGHRECDEETGCTVEDDQPIGFIRMISEGEAPEDWRYAHPVSYQQFYAGRMVAQRPYEDNDECAQPIVVSDFTNIERADIRVFGEAALAMFR